VRTRESKEQLRGCIRLLGFIAGKKPKGRFGIRGAGFAAACRNPGTHPEATVHDGAAIIGPDALGTIGFIALVLYPPGVCAPAFEPGRSKHGPPESGRDMLTNSDFDQKQGKITHKFGRRG